MNDLFCCQVAESTGATEARRRAFAAARELGFGEVEAESVGIVTMELATNLYRHGGGGELLVRSVSCGDVPGMELVALDQGAGLRDPSAALRDGFSTAGGLGTGLGAVQRFSALFDMYAPPGRGTVVFSRIWARPPDPRLPRRPFTVGAFSVPLAGESACGDSWAVHQDGDHALFLVVDGLGHGASAAEASAMAVETFRRRPDDGPLALVTALDEALRPTRGAAVAVSEALTGADAVNHAGLGNIAARVVSSGGSSQLVSDGGIAGAGTRQAHLRPSAYPAGALLVQHSDGVSARWKSAEYVGLWGHHPVVIAAVLFRDQRRRRDDATVVVARQETRP
jgi:anti-sigma regulatory factor (Ser/Thr protein kinase)